MKMRISLAGLLAGIVIVLGAAAWSLDDAKAKKETTEIGKAIGKGMKFSETSNFTWASSLPAGRQKKISTAAEKAYKVFADQAGLGTWRDIWDKQKVMGVLVPDKRTYRKFNAWYASQHRVWDGFVKQHERATYYIEAQQRHIMVTHVKPHDDKHLANTMVHLAGHMIANRYKFHRNFVPPWIEECLGVYMESVVLKKHACKCFRDVYGTIDPETSTKGGFPTAKWKKIIKKDIKKRRYANLTSLFRVRLHEMSLQDAGKGFATIHWMMSQKGKFPKFLAAVKKNWPQKITPNYDPAHGKAQEKAFQEVFGMTMQEVENAVAEHVASSF